MICAGHFYPLRWDTVNLFVTALSVILNPVPSVEFADNTEATNWVMNVDEL